MYIQLEKNIRKYWRNFVESFRQCFVHYTFLIRFPFPSPYNRRRSPQNLAEFPMIAPLRLSKSESPSHVRRSTQPTQAAYQLCFVSLFLCNRFSVSESPQPCPCCTINKFHSQRIVCFMNCLQKDLTDHCCLLPCFLLLSSIIEFFIVITRRVGILLNGNMLIDL